MVGDHSLQLGGRVFDLDDRVAAGAGAAATTLTEAIADLQREFGERAGLKLTFVRLQVTPKRRAQVIAWKTGPGEFTLETDDDMGLSRTKYTNHGDLFDALAAHVSRAIVEWPYV